MYDPHIVRVAERDRDIDGEVERTPDIKSFTRVEHIVQTAAVNKIHRVVVSTLILANVVDSHYIRMVEFAESFHFSLEPLHICRVECKLT